MKFDKVITKIEENLHTICFFIAVSFACLAARKEDIPHVIIFSALMISMVIREVHEADKKNDEKGE